MPGEIISGAAPTRMQLIALRKRHRIAERGGDLLREKLDALMIEFFQFAREISALRQRTQDILAQTYRRFAEAEMLMGFERLAEASLTVQDRFDVEASTRNVIGVSIPHASVKVRPLEGYPYSMLGTSSKLDEAVGLMSEAVKNMVELSAAEAAIRRLAEAIAATKRRVNSLEYIVIPRIENTIRYIEMSLQEREREDFFRLKRIKKRLEQEEAMQPVAPCFRRSSCLFMLAWVAGKNNGGWGQINSQALLENACKSFLLQIFSVFRLPFDGYLEQFMRRIDGQSESIRKVSHVLSFEVLPTPIFTT